MLSSMLKHALHWLTKAKFFVFIAAFLMLVLLIASRPYIVSQENIGLDQIANYPELKNQFDQLSQSNRVIPGEYIVASTVRSIWGSCTVYLLPCYTILMRDIPENGNTAWNTSLFILSYCSNENSIIAKQCRLSLRDVCVDIVVDGNTLISTLVEIDPGNTKYDTWGEYSVELQNNYSLPDTSPLCISFLASTAGSAHYQNIPAIGRIYWRYSIFCNNLRIINCQDVELKQEYVVNAQQYTRKYIANQVFLGKSK